MNGFIKYLTTDKIVWYGMLASCGLLLLSIIYLLIFYRMLPPLMPIYNQLPWGEARLGGKLELFIPIGVTLLIIGTNLGISRFIYDRLPLLVRMLLMTSLLLSILTVYFIVRIVLLIV